MWKEILRGKTLCRAMQNQQYKNIHLVGKVIDLGSKTDNASMYRFIQRKEDVDITFTDINPTTDKILRVDCERGLDISSSEYDMVILNNVLEHLYNYQMCAMKHLEFAKRELCL